MYGSIAPAALICSKYMLFKPKATSAIGLFFSAISLLVASAPPAPTISILKPASAAFFVSHSPRPSPLELV